MKLKKFILMSCFIYIGCANNLVNQITPNVETKELNQTTLNVEIEELNQTAPNVETEELNQTTLNVETEELNQTASNVKNDYCEVINYRNQSYLHTLNIKTVYKKNMYLYKNSYKQITLQSNELKEEDVKSDCKENAETQNRVFGFKKVGDICVCAYGERKE